MAEPIHTVTLTITDKAGTVYDRVHVYAEAQERGMWEGVIEFVAADDSHTVRTPRETTQSSVAAVAYWATGLEPIYFEGALDRALRHRREPREAAATPRWRVASVEIVSPDAQLPARIMDARTPPPGLRRHVHDTAIVAFEGMLEPHLEGTVGHYGFLVEFGSENGAALVANTLWSGSHSDTTRVLVEDTPIAMNHSLIKDALLRLARPIGEAA